MLKLFSSVKVACTVHTRERMPEDAGPCLILTHGAGCLGPRSVELQTSAGGPLSGNVGTCWGSFWQARTGSRTRCSTLDCGEGAAP